MESDPLLDSNRRAEYNLRRVVNKHHYNTKAHIDHNDDVLEIPYFKACFTKSLPHDKDGKAEKEEVDKMLKGILKCKCFFDKINYQGKLRLVNPSCIFSWDLIGPYKSSIPIPPTPSFQSAEAAAEMVELYAMALLRDIPFSKWDSHPEVTKIIEELNLLSEFTGPRENDKVTPRTLFRGNSKGDLKGPYVSQFMYLPFNHGISDIDQKYSCYKEANFMTTWDTVLNVQNGTVTEGPLQRIDKRYIITLRDGCTYVHLDDSIQSAQCAALILNKLKCPGPKGSPFGKSVKEVPFVDMGGLDIYDLMCRVVRVSMLCAWYHKWNILKLRPEEFGMEVQKSNNFIHSDLINSKILEWIHKKYGSYLLPQVYPEGAPAHPSYPAGHAVFAGATVTILKAFYDEDFMIDAYAPNEDGSKLLPLGYKLRVGDELDKLASNISMFRNTAGVHYRSDAIGIEMGEEIAILMLKEHVLRYCHEIEFKFHRRNGEIVEISNKLEKED